MSWRLSNSSKKNLKGVHPDLIKVVERALELSPYDFGISEGVRTLETQKKYLEEGKSTTPKSMHLAQKDGYSHAVDIKIYVNGSITWEIGYFRKVAQAFFKAAIELGVQLEWGGLWKDFVDGPHFQLDRSYR